MRQKDRKRKETGRTMGDRGRGENDREHDTLPEKDRDREQDKVIQRGEKRDREAGQSERQAIRDTEQDRDGGGKA